MTKFMQSASVLSGGHLQRLCATCFRNSR